jgi:peroxiredoxin
MGKWLPRCLLVPAVLLVLAGAANRPHAETPSAHLGKAVRDFALPDTHGKKVSLASFRTKKAIVVVFVGTQCPINNAYMPRLAQLAREFQAKGVQVLAINANRQDTPGRVAEHAKQHRLRFPVLKDQGNVVADQFGARRTPEAFILDVARRMRYQGRIDDQYGIDYQRPRPTRRDLAVALEEILAGKDVSRPTTPVAGCRIARAMASKKQGPITYSREVARILQKNCQECHRPGQIGPMSLLSYDDAVSWAETIGEVLRDQRMPPWYADPRYGKFQNDRRLSPADRRALLTWIAGGTPRGEDWDLPPPQKFAAGGWRIGKPDVVFHMPREYAVPAKMPRSGIPYQEFFVETNFREDRWIVRAEARPGSPAVVHHILVFIVPPGKQFIAGNPETPTLAGIAPGDMPSVLPPGFAKKIPKGSRLVFQMHYTPNGIAQKDRSCVGLIFAKQPPKYAVTSEPVYNIAFRIPPGAANHPVEAWYTFKKDGYITSFMPHMHLRGKDFRYEVVYPGGKKEVLLSVPRFNFGWQSVYRAEKPLRMPKGARLHCIAHFDNSANNPNNPDPRQAVYWGDQTWEEMMVGWTDVAFEVPGL